MVSCSPTYPLAYWLIRIAQGVLSIFCTLSCAKSPITVSMVVNHLLDTTFLFLFMRRVHKYICPFPIVLYVIDDSHIIRYVLSNITHEITWLSVYNNAIDSWPPLSPSRVFGYLAIDISLFDMRRSRRISSVTLEVVIEIYRLVY